MPNSRGDEEMKRSGENMRTLATAYMHSSIFIVQSVSKPAIASREQGKFHGEYLQPTLLPMRLWIISSDNRNGKTGICQLFTLILNACRRPGL